MTATATQLQSLVQGAASGDRAAFTRLHDDLNSLVMFVCGRGLSYESAEDAAQATWLNVWKYAGKYDPAKGSVRTWVSRIALRCAIDQQRKDTVRAVVPLDDWDGAQRFTANTPDHSRLVGNIIATRLQGKRTKECATLHLIRGVPIAETARATGSATGTVKSTCHRVMTMARRVLA